MVTHKERFYEFIKVSYKELNRDVLQLILDSYIINNITLHDACNENWFYAIDLLLSKGYKINESHMTIVAEHGYYDLVKFFNENWGLIYDKNYYYEGNYAIDMASANNHLEIVKYLVENKKKHVKHNSRWICSTHAIDNACENGNLEIIKYLYSKNVYGTCEAFENAYNNKHYHILEWLNENMSRYINYYSDRTFYF